MTMLQWMASTIMVGSRRRRRRLWTMEASCFPWGASPRWRQTRNLSAEV